jgi:hypothetical protein
LNLKKAKAAKAVAKAPAAPPVVAPAVASMSLASDVSPATQQSRNQQPTPSTLGHFGVTLIDLCAWATFLALLALALEHAGRPYVELSAALTLGGGLDC